VSQPGRIDDQLAAIESRGISSSASAMAALAQMTAVINAELSGTTAAGTDALAPATGERLERWIERLRAVAEEVVHQFGALSYSITVGLPAGVSVTVTWSPTGSD
jgi:hypothetical protein